MTVNEYGLAVAFQDGEPPKPGHGRNSHPEEAAVIEQLKARPDRWAIVWSGNKQADGKMANRVRSLFIRSDVKAHSRTTGDTVSVWAKYLPPAEDAA
jgi:hypothetical protein